MTSFSKYIPTATNAYMDTNKLPSSQLLRALDRQIATMNTDIKYKETSNRGNLMVISFPVNQPTMTVTGNTNRAICTEDPNATLQFKKGVRDDTQHTTDKSKYAIVVVLTQGPNPSYSS